uniref:Uncharacterized protein n=1 Tax=Anguilla anguilla TaxID=7936 RepID=A0A0E9SCR1_ANGAN
MVLFLSAIIIIM